MDRLFNERKIDINNSGRINKEGNVNEEEGEDEVKDKKNDNDFLE